MIVSQSQWGSALEYDDYTLNGGWDPQYIIMHWGGLTRERGTFELATATLRGWQAYHRRKGWQDIGYNYAVDELGNMYRLRGENHGGHTSGIDPKTGKSWSTVGVGIVWIGGRGDLSGPSSAALERVGTYTAKRGLPILGHQETGKATSCPGPDWLEFANTGIILPTEGTHMLIEKGHPVEATVEKIQLALIEWNESALPKYKADGDFGGETAAWVAAFQSAHNLPDTGKVDDETAWLLA